MSIQNYEYFTYIFLKTRISDYRSKCCSAFRIDDDYSYYYDGYLTMRHQCGIIQYRFEMYQPSYNILTAILRNKYFFCSWRVSWSDVLSYDCTSSTTTSLIFLILIIQIQQGDNDWLVLCQEPEPLEWLW